MDILERLAALEVSSVIDGGVVLHVRRDDEVVGTRILLEARARQLETSPDTGRVAVYRGIEVDEAVAI